MRKNKDIIIFIVAVVLIIGVVWFVRSKNPSSSNISTSTKLQVTTSFYPLYFFATQIAGDKADVTNIIPTGVEPHDYEPSAQDIIKIQNSKILFLNGGGVEAWGDKIKQSVSVAHTSIVTVGKDIINQVTPDGGNNITDPHIWLSPPLAKLMVAKIEAEIAGADSTNASYYEANAQTLVSKLSDLDTLYQNGLTNCKETSFVTSHSAFSYLATAYHLTQIPIAGLSPDAEPSPKQLGSVIELARQNNIKYIFFESLASPKLSETIAREVGAQTLVLNPIEGLTPAELKLGEDYFTEMKKNLVNLQLALGCK